MRVNRRPFGFVILAICALGFGAVMLALLAEEPLDGELVARALVAATGAISFVAAEALWFGRAWALRASVALALTWAALLVRLAVDRNVGWVAIVLGGISALVILPILDYVRREMPTLGRIRRHGPLPPFPP
jgi:hypothetical protein